MRGKKAKELRRLAEQATIGQPEKMYNHIPSGIRGGISLELSTSCTRKVYKILKANYKKGLI